MSSATCFNLDQSTILLSGNGLLFTTQSQLLMTLKKTSLQALTCEDVKKKALENKVRTVFSAL